MLDETTAGDDTNWKATVMMNVWIGFTFGITAKTVSPTNPLEVD